MPAVSVVYEQTSPVFILPASKHSAYDTIIVWCVHVDQDAGVIKGNFADSCCIFAQHIPQGISCGKFFQDYTRKE